jgi:predicted RNase H-like HicB family nuclease
MTDTYTAEVRWEDHQWQATVQDVPGAHTYARTMTALRKRLREVIVLMDDRPDSDLHDEDAFTVNLAVSVTAQDGVDVTDSVASSSSEATSESVTTETLTPVTVTRSTSWSVVESVATSGRPDTALQLAANARRRAAEAEAEAEHATRIAVLMAQRAGISMRDIAMLLGISHQRVQQIAAAAPSDLLADSTA